MKQIIRTTKAPRAIGPYSQAIRAGSMIFASGQIPIDPETGEVTGEDVEEQTGQVLKNLSAILEEAGSSLEHVLKTTVYMTDLKNFERMNNVYSKFFKESPPARATIGVAGLPRGVKVEIDAIAITAG